MARGTQCGGDHDRAAAVLQDGIAASELGHLSTSVATLESALTYLPGLGGCSVEHDRLAARILLSLAFVVHELGRTADGVAILVRAEAVATRRGLADLTLLARAQHGVLLIREGRIEEAVTQLDRAVQLLDRAPPVDQGKILINRGEAHHLLGAIGPAMADFSRAVDLGHRHRLPELAFAAQHNLGFMHYLAGDLPRSLELMPTVEQARSDHYKGVVGIDRAKVLLGAGLVAEADQTLVEACTALERTELVPLLAEAELARADAALLAERPDQAGSLAERATKRLRARNNPRSTALARLVQLRIAESLAEPPDELGTRAERLAAELARVGLPDQARLARLIGREADLTRDGATGAFPRLGPGEPYELRLRARLLRTRLALAQGNRARAHREIRTGLTELAAYQSQLGSLDLQTASAAYGVRLARIAIADALAHDEAAAVLTWLERGRAISGRVPPVRPPADEVTAGLLTQLRWVAEQVEASETSGRPTEALRRQRQQLERDVRARSWTLRGDHPVAQVPRLAELRASLGPTALGPATMVAVFRLSDRLHGVVLSTERCWTRPLAGSEETLEVARRLSADLDVLAVAELPAALRTAALASYRSGLQRLDDLLLRPLGLLDPGSAGTPVVLLPPGGLSALPWGQLPTLAGRPVTVAPSASAWLRATRRPDTAGPTVAVSGPGLERASGEVSGVARSWPGAQVLTGDDATCAAVLTAVDGARIAHLAAHGRHQRQSPLFSSLRLVDGPLVGYDLERVAEPPQLVVLSACDLGQATVRIGDEALGLTRALLHRGVRTVVSGVAKVSDHRTAAWMAAYHRRLAAGVPPAFALAEAAASSAEPMPFVCFGAGW